MALLSISLAQYTANFKRRFPDVTQKVLFAGNGNKSLRLSVEASLRKLRLTYPVSPLLGLLHQN
jgi:hypothetical protein